LRAGTVQGRRPIKLVALALLALSLLALPADARSPEGRARKAVRAALKKETLPDGQRVTCKRRGKSKRRLTCRTSAEQGLSPNRTRVCAGRFRVRIARGRARARRAHPAKCSVRVQAMDPELGFNDNAVRGEQLSEEADARLTEGVGAGISRLGLDWRAIEPSRDVYHWERYDRLYKALLERGIRPLFVLAYAPSWTWDPLSLCAYYCHYPPARQYLGEWRELAGLAAARYPEAAGIEIWNEPNEVDFWKPAPDVARYTELLITAYDGIKAANPDMTVVSAGVSNRGGGIFQGNVPMRMFLNGIYDHGGGGHFDALGLHGYPGTLEFEEYERTLREAREVRNARGDPRMPLWVTETGFSTTDDDPLFRVTENEQATAIADNYRRLKAEPDVDAIIFHALIEPPEGGRNGGFGIVRGDLSLKPAYCALARAVGVRSCP
jgi:polysaccharide biosynthesis protein PslG